MVVGALPKRGMGRGVVSTASYEARKFGIHSGQPISIAYRKCPKAVFLPVNFLLYEKVSQNIMSLLKFYGDKLEIAGLDEAYLDLSLKVKSCAEAKFLALKIKSDILKKERLTCSIGIGPNKLIAKIASGFQKPNGLTMIKPEKVEAFLSPLPVEEIPGVGPKSQSFLNQLGIRTIQDLRKLSKRALKDYFGKWGDRLYDLARGIDESEITEIWEIKSVGREYTFQKDTRDKELIFKTLRELIEETVESLKAEKLSGKTITVKVRYQDFETHTCQKTFDEATASPAFIEEMSKNLLLPFLADKRAVRLIGVRISNFT